jgi:hypothetical protein
MADNEEWSDQALEKIITEASSSFYPNNSFPFSENDLQLNKANKNYTSHGNL